MDTTRLDVFAMDPQTLRSVAVDLTVGMDWYSRCITGLRLDAAVDEGYRRGRRAVSVISAHAGGARLAAGGGLAGARGAAVRPGRTAGTGSWQLQCGDAGNRAGDDRGGPRQNLCR